MQKNMVFSRASGIRSLFQRHSPGGATGTASRDNVTKASRPTASSVDLRNTKS